MPSDVVHKEAEKVRTKRGGEYKRSQALMPRHGTSCARIAIEDHF